EGASTVLVRDVSCASSSYCIAVGYYYSNESHPLVEKWNGSSWSLQSAPNPPEGGATDAMLSVSCVSSTSCVAVGKAGGKPVVQSWNGTSWSSAVLAKPSGATTAALEGVSCISATACTAVGNFLESGIPRALAETWNGSSWTQQSIPNPGEGAVDLRNVTCLSSSSCTAVGSYVSQWKVSGEETERKTLVESWNGSSWSIQPSTNPQTFSLLNAVSCTASTACTAVGSSRPKVGEEGRVTLGERYE